MVMLGGVIKKTGVVDLDSVSGCLEKVLSERAMALLDLNKQALKKGFEEVA
jgi:Pyruvate/2-oxoacid:ferredoxin oxidoreductase gamma subunit